MTSARAGTYTETFRAQHGAVLTEALDGAATAATGGDFSRAAVLAAQVRDSGDHLHHSVVRDALTAGLDWWQIADLLHIHPQAAFLDYANLLAGTLVPAEQHPDLAVLCTAGLVALHETPTEYGIDLDDIDTTHSLNLDPNVLRLRAAAHLLAEDIWITVTLPSPYEGEDDLPDNAAITRWTTVVTHPDELGSLREALTLNVTWEDPTEDDDVEPRYP
jgi:hypothetical protein